MAAATAAPPPMAMSVSAEELAAEEQRKREQVRELAAEYRIEPARIHIELGGPAEVLPRIAGAQHADHVVVRLLFLVWADAISPNLE